MQRILMSAWVALAVIMLVSIMAQAQEAHPIHDNALPPPVGKPGPAPAIRHAAEALQEHPDTRKSGQ